MPYFEWIDCHQEDKCIYVFKRMSKNQQILVILNFSNKKQIYKFKSQNFHKLQLLLASDNEIYGGCKKYSGNATISLKKDMPEIEINAFTGLMYEIIANVKIKM